MIPSKCSLACLPFLAWIVGILWSVGCDVGIGIPPEKQLDGALVFVMNDSTVGPWGIYTMGLDGSDLKSVAVDGDTINFPGTWGEKYVLGQTTSPSVLNYPRWSPDGSKIACELMWAFEGYVIVIMDADGSNKQALWEVRAAARLPQWSPEGDRMLFLRSAYAGAVIAIGIVDISGKDDMDFPISSPAVFEGDSIWFGHDYQWGQTGNLIYSTGSVNKEPDPVYALGSNESNEIFALDSQTGAVVARVTRNAVDEGGFRMSTDGRTIVYQRGAYGLPSSLYFIDVSTNSIEERKIGRYVDIWWNWAKRRKLLVYAGDIDPDPFRNQEFQLYSLDVDRAVINKISNFKAMHPDLVFK